MGFFKDIKNLQKQAEAMTPPEHRGMMGGFRAMKDGVAQANTMLGDMQADAQKAQYLQLNGKVGSAQISAMRDTGMTVNDNPTVEFDLAVSVDGASPYMVTHRQVISRLAIGHFQPGATIPVKVDPANPQSVLIG